MRVQDLRVGDRFEVGGIPILGQDNVTHLTFIAQTEHPTYHGLQLVIWRFSNGKHSFDALSPLQDVGEPIPSDGTQRLKWLMDDLQGLS